MASEKGANVCVLLGRLQGDAKKIDTQRGFGCSFVVATNRRFRLASGEWKDEVAWVPCKYWNSEKVFTYLEKGRKVHVVGHLTTVQLEDESGRKNTVMEINVDDLTLVDKPALPANEAQAAHDAGSERKRSRLADVDPAGYATAEQYRAYLDQCAVRQMDDFEAERKQLDAERSELTRANALLIDQQNRARRQLEALEVREREHETQVKALADALPLEDPSRPRPQKRPAAAHKRARTARKTR